MKILVINLPRYQGYSVTREMRCELYLNYRVDTPTSLLLIASILRKKNYEIDFIDANGLNLSYDFIKEELKIKKFDCVIFTFASIIIDQELKICKIVKNIQPSCILIGFSWYARNFSKEILNSFKDLDIIIHSDLFSVIGELIDFIDNDKDLAQVKGITYRNRDKNICVNPGLTAIKKFQDLPLPAFDLLKTFKPYYIYSPFLKPYALVYAGRGCPFRCSYCNVSNTSYSGRSAENIINELKFLKKLGNIKYVWFFDEIFTLNRKRVIEVCNNMIKEKLKIKWLCDSRVDLVDKEILKLMRRAGCIGISYGVESGSQEILNSMKKGITIDQAKKALIWTRKAHIPIQLNMIIGYIGESRKTLKESEKFINAIVPDFLQVTQIMALENTEFCKIANEKGWIDHNVDWKSNLTNSYYSLKNYDPYKLDLKKEKKRLQKMLYHNPKWRISCLITLIRNPILFLPIIGVLIKRKQSIKVL